MTRVMTAPVTMRIKVRSSVIRNFSEICWRMELILLIIGFTMRPLEGEAREFLIGLGRSSELLLFKGFSALLRAALWLQQEFERKRSDDMLG